MKMRRSFISSSDILKILAFTILICASFALANNVLLDKDSKYKYADFFNETNSFDVLFFGSSHTEVFISPFELWMDYGITSYNFGNPEEGIPITYWVINNAIKRNKPEIVVLDTYMFGFNETYVGEETMHYALDSFPLNSTKLEAINDLTDDTNIKFEMIFKLGNYHSRWKYIDESAFVDVNKYMKGNMSYGYYHTTQINPYEQYSVTNECADVNECYVDTIYLKRIIDLCKNENVDLILITTPYICDEIQQKRNNLVEYIANTNNVPYINMTKLDNLIDTKTDMYDLQHVNQSGLQKVTKYIGSYLCKNYKIIDHRTQAQYQRWNEQASEYKMLKFEWIMWQDDLDKVLMMLHDDDITSYIFCKSRYKGNNIDEFSRLLQNIGNKNLTVYNSSQDDIYKNKLSVDLNTLNEKYLLLNSDSGIYEFFEKDAECMLEETCGDKANDLNQYDIVIVLLDRNLNEIRLVQGYSLDENMNYKSNNLYSTVIFKNFFRD